MLATPRLGKRRRSAATTDVGPVGLFGLAYLRLARSCFWHTRRFIPLNVFCVGTSLCTNQAMLNESSEKAHQLVALGLLARVFYAQEPLGKSFVLQDMRLGCRICSPFSGNNLALLPYSVPFLAHLRLFRFIVCEYVKYRQPPVEEWSDGKIYPPVRRPSSMTSSVLCIMSTRTPIALARTSYDEFATDKLHDIVRSWQPGKYTKRFLCHVVELVHTTLKTLEWYQGDKPKAKFIGGIDVSAMDAKDAEGAVDKAVLDRVASAKNFGFHRYFERLATNPYV